MRLIIFLLLIVPTTAWGASPYVLAVAGSSVGVEAAIQDDFSTNSASDYTTLMRGITVTGGRAEGGGNGYQPAAVVHSYNLGAADHYVQARIVYSSTSPRYQSTLVFRVTPGADPTANATGYLLIFDGGTTINLSKFANSNFGAPTWVGAWTLGQTWGDTDDYVARIECSGSSISLFIDWNDDGDFSDSNESVGTKTDSSYSGTYVGLWWNNLDGTEGWADDLEADTL